VPAAAGSAVLLLFLLALPDFAALAASVEPELPPPPTPPPPLVDPLPPRCPWGGLFPTSILCSVSCPCWAPSACLLPAILFRVLVMTLFALSLADCTVAAVGAGRWGAFRRSLLLLSILDSLAAAAAKDDPAQSN
jgi:hypothetical protein